MAVRRPGAQRDRRAAPLARTNGSAKAMPAAGPPPVEKYGDWVETVTADSNRPKVLIRSLADYAEAIGVKEEEVLASSALLSAGCRGEPLSRIPAPPSGCRCGLDSYQVRGSFDDRTLL